MNLGFRAAIFVTLLSALAYPIFRTREMVSVASERSSWRLWRFSN